MNFPMYAITQGAVNFPNYCFNFDFWGQNKTFHLFPSGLMPYLKIYIFVMKVFSELHTYVVGSFEEAAMWVVMVLVKKEGVSTSS